mmetsp:Transcript_20264/g.50993  ORF Transcript_20264/g.50993 Transcript_20264/m.50993 type:complete len:343 (+) Transcript_20264:406-1434(+)
MPVRGLVLVSGLALLGLCFLNVLQRTEDPHDVRTSWCRLLRKDLRRTASGLSLRRWPCRSLHSRAARHLGNAVLCREEGVAKTVWLWQLSKRRFRRRRRSHWCGLTIAWLLLWRVRGRLSCLWWPLCPLLPLFIRGVSLENRLEDVHGFPQHFGLGGRRRDGRCHRCSSGALFCYRCAPTAIRLSQAEAAQKRVCHRRRVCPRRHTRKVLIRFCAVTWRLGTCGRLIPPTSHICLSSMCVRVRGGRLRKSQVIGHESAPCILRRPLLALVRVLNPKALAQQRLRPPVFRDADPCALVGIGCLARTAATGALYRFCEGGRLDDATAQEGPFLDSSATRKSPGK